MYSVFKVLSTQLITLKKSQKIRYMYRFSTTAWPVAWTFEGRSSDTAGTQQNIPLGSHWWFIHRWQRGASKSNVPVWTPASDQDVWGTLKRIDRFRIIRFGTYESIGLILKQWPPTYFLINQYHPIKHNLLDESLYMFEVSIVPYTDSANLRRSRWRYQRHFSSHCLGYPRQNAALQRAILWFPWGQNSVPYAKRAVVLVQLKWGRNISL